MRSPNAEGYLSIWSKGIPPECKRQVLDFIAGSNGQTVKETAEALNMDHRTTVQIITGLAKHGFIRKATGPAKSGEPYKWMGNA